MCVPFTIAIEGSITDKAAIEFSRGFYDAIGAGRDIEFSYDEGCRALKLSAPTIGFSTKLLKNPAKIQEQIKAKAESVTTHKQHVEKTILLQEIDREILIHLNETKLSNFDLVKSKLTLSRTKSGHVTSMPTDSDIRTSSYSLKKHNVIEIDDRGRDQYYKINDHGREWLFENR